jgi:hypothetical protein
VETWIQAVPTIFLIGALLLAIRYVWRRWPASRDGMIDELRRATGTIRSVVPGLSREIGRMRRRFRNELSRLFPLWSAATTQNREAEFVHDRLPDRFPFWIVALAAVVVTSVIWFITR